MTPRLTWFFSFVIHLHLLVILAHRGQLVRCCIVDFTGPPSSRMRGGFATHVCNAREREKPFLGDNRCLNNPCCSVRSSMFGVYISWAISLFLLVSLTSYFLLITSQSGWKLKPPGLTMLELL